MKQLISLSFILLLFNTSKTLAQEYYVSNVRGEIYHFGTKKYLKAGMMLDGVDSVKFETSEARALLISKSNGRMILKPYIVKEESNIDEFIGYVKNALLPMKAELQMSTRNQDKIELTEYFSDSNFCIIGNELRVSYDDKKYIVKKGLGFFVSYKYPEETQTIRKEVSIEKNQLIFNKKALYQKGKQIFNPYKAGKMGFYFYGDSPRNPTKIADFYLIFIDEKDLKDELKSLKEYLISKGTTKAQLRAEFVKHIKFSYGNTDMEVLNQWLKEKKLVQ